MERKYNITVGVDWWMIDDGAQDKGLTLITFMRCRSSSSSDNYRDRILLIVLGNVIVGGVSDPLHHSLES